MATTSFTTSYNGSIITFTVTYSFTQSSGIFKITGVTAKTHNNMQGYITSWVDGPKFIFYIVPGTSGVANEGSYGAYRNAETWIQNNNGKYISYRGNDPYDYFSGTSGGTKTWASSLLTNLSLNFSGYSGNTANVMIGSVVQNDGTSHLGEAFYGKLNTPIVLDLYTAPSAYSVNRIDRTDTSITFSHNWTYGSVTNQNSYTTRSIKLVQTNSGSVIETKTNVAKNTSVIFSNLNPNESYTAQGTINDGKTTLTAQKEYRTLVTKPNNIISVHEVNSLTIRGVSTNVVDISNPNLYYKYELLNKVGTVVSTKNAVYNEDVTFTDLLSNNKYTVLVYAYNPNILIDDVVYESAAFSKDVWTKPLLSSISLSRVNGQEHDKIEAIARIALSSDYDQYSFKLNSGSYSEYSDSNTIQYSDLTENTLYTVSCRVKNTESGLVSDVISNSITTWYDPISNLTVNLSNKWFWLLEILSKFTYNGTITKYEFSIGNESYQDKGTTNLYSKGSAVPGQIGNLNYNTDYICKVRLTDNHGRTAEASGTFKTMDERSLYVNGVLREVKLIKPDGSISYITPNLLSVIKPDNTVINMNKIINNDSRISFS